MSPIDATAAALAALVLLTLVVQGGVLILDARRNNRKLLRLTVAEVGRGLERGCRVRLPGRDQHAG